MMRSHHGRLRLAWLLTLFSLSVLLFSACGAPAATITPTPAATPTTTPPPGTFYFKTDDGVTLNGQIYGQGTTAIVLSSQDEDPGSEWQALATKLAAQGYLVMTYNWRGVDPSQGRYDRTLLDHDLRAAMDAARAHGASKIVLMGASMGGLVTAKVASATATHPTAVVILSAPTSYGGVSVSDDELKSITAPKFFVVGQQDTQFSSAVQQMYDVSVAPKTLQVYPNHYHGVDFFTGPETRDDFTARLFAFLSSTPLRLSL